MPVAMPLTTKISQSSVGSTSYRWNVARLGDGYEQRVPDGINYQMRKWMVTFDNLTASEFTTMTTFLDTAGTGDFITWTPPGYVTQLKWVLDGEVSVNVKAGNLYAVSFPVRQVYDVG